MKHAFAPLSLVLLVAITASAQPALTLSPETTVVPSFSRRVIADVAEYKVPAFAAAGRNGDYLLAWTEYDVNTAHVALVTAKLDANGAIVPGTRHVAPAQRAIDPDAQFPAVAFDGDRFLVLWNEGFTVAPRLLGMRFGRDGKPLDPVPFIVSLAATQTSIAATAANGEFLVTYGYGPGFGGRGAALARIAPDGTVRERDVRLLGTIGNWRDIETNGTSMFIATEWTVFRPSCVIEFCGAASFRTFLNMPLSAPRASAAHVIADGGSNVAPIGPGVATDGQRYLVVSWARNNAIAQIGTLLRGQLTDPSGASFIRELVVAKSPEPYLGGIQSGRIDAVWTGGMYAIAYEAFSDQNIDVRFTLVSQIGSALVDPVTIGGGAAQERMPVVLPVSENRVLVLYERSTGTDRQEIVARTAGIAIKNRAVR